MKRALLILLLVLAACTAPTGNIVQERPLRTGAILPLSGPAAVWGDALREGMELAREEFQEEGKTIEIIYADSQADAAKGVTAYHDLRQREVDVVLSAFSRVSIPLIPLADEDRTPLIMTLVAANDATNKSPYAFRLYATAREYVDPHFESMDGQYPTVAVLALNDEYGASVRQIIKEDAQRYGIQIVAEETFSPGTTDFRTQLAKIAEKKPSAIIFVGAVPTELVNVVRQMREQKLNATFIEAAPLLTVPLVREQAQAEGATTVAFPFSLGTTGAEFRQNFRERYGKEPNYYNAIGYDTVRLVGEASGGKSLPGERLVKSILMLRSFNSTNGELQIQPNGEINPPMFAAKVENGRLVAIT